MMMKHQDVDIDQQNSIKINQNINNLPQLLTLPVQKIRQIKRSEMEIISMLATSTKCQHSSFETKYNVFKQIMTSFIETNEKLEEEIFSVFDRDNEEKKAKQILSANKKNNNDMLKNEKKDFVKGKSNKEMNEKISETEKKEKNNNATINMKQNTEEKPSHLMNENKKKRNMMRTEEESHNSDNESDLDEKIEKTQQKQLRKRKAKEWDNASQCDNRSVVSRRTSYSDLTRRDGKFSMEDKIEWIERIIDSKIMIPKVYGNFGELLLLPYSVLQKLIDYNESADYGVNK